MEEESVEAKIKENKNLSSVQLHITTLQNIIQRMASNSANCKTWCITIVSAMLALLIDKDKLDYYFFIAIPIVIFAFLDAYYLHLERTFRHSYDRFVDSINSVQFDYLQVFKISSAKFNCCKKLEVLLSPSIWLFYGIFFVLIIFFKFYWMNGNV